MGRIQIFLILVTLLACKKDPKACFSYHPDSDLKIGDSILFSNCSENAISYYWDFSDGTNSTEENPVHIFERTGYYNVILTANHENNSDIFSNYILISDKYLWVTGSSRKDSFDIDKDGIMDLIIQMYEDNISSMFGGTSGGTSLTLLNGYEIKVSEYDIKTCYDIWYDEGGIKDTCELDDSALMPKIHNINDTAKIEDLYVSGSVSLTHWEGPSGPEKMCHDAIKGDSIDTKCYQGIVQDIWISPDYRYLVLRKKGENENILAWLKVKVVGFTKMVVSGYKCYKNQNEVILTE